MKYLKNESFGDVGKAIVLFEFFNFVFELAFLLYLFKSWQMAKGIENSLDNRI